MVNLIKRMFARPCRWAAVGLVSTNKENDHNWRLFEAVLIPLPSTPLQALFCSGSFPPSGALLQGQMRTTHVVIIYLNVVGGVVRVGGGRRREFIIRSAKFVFMFLPHRFSVQSVCVEPHV